VAVQKFFSPFFQGLGAASSESAVAVTSIVFGVQQKSAERYKEPYQR
jgi:hypothetical protein